MAYRSPAGATIALPLPPGEHADNVNVVEQEQAEASSFLRSPVLSIEASFENSNQLDDVAIIQFPSPDDRRSNDYTIVVFDDVSRIWVPVPTSASGENLRTETRTFSSWSVAPRQVDREELVPHQLLRQEGKGRSCEGDPPFWVDGPIETEPGPSPKLEVCASTDDRDRLVLRLSNPKSIAVRVEFNVPIDEVGPARIEQRIYESLKTLNEHLDSLQRGRMLAEAPQSWVFIPGDGSVDIAFSDPGLMQNNDPDVDSMNQPFGQVVGHAVYDLDTWGAHSLFALVQMVPPELIAELDLAKCVRSLAGPALGRSRVSIWSDYLDCIEAQFKALGARMDRSTLAGRFFSLLRVLRMLTFDHGYNAYNVLANDDQHEILFRSKNRSRHGGPPVTPPPSTTAERTGAGINRPAPCRDPDYESPFRDERFFPTCP